MKNLLMEALKKSTADYAEIRIETHQRTWLGYRGREMESAGSSSHRGGMVRACTKGGWGHVTFDSLDNLADHVQQACHCAALVGREKTELAEIAAVDDEKPAALKRDFRGVSLDDKLKVITRYNDIVLKSAPSIRSSFVTYVDVFRTVHFASTRGNYFMEERPFVACYVSATAANGALVQRATESFASAVTYDVVLGLESIAEEVALRADALLRAPKVDGGPQTVILNPLMAGVFIHEAFGHISEADFLYENPRMSELMVLGRRMGPKFLNVIDDGSRDRTIGSFSFDDEGTPTSKTWLIKDGVLSGHLHSLETAAKMGEQPTGNARAIGRGVTPIVRMTNTYIDNGTTPVEDLFAGVDRGVYACNSMGGQTEFEMFTFSAGHGYRIENGKKGELIRDVVLTGSVFETLKCIDAIGNDLIVHEGGGGCGKGGQGPLPVGLGAPHVRIQNVLIGGA